MARSKVKKAKVILLHNLAKKGKFGDIIEVKRGYAKFLCMKKIALPGIKENIDKFEILKNEAAAKAEQSRNEAILLSEKINVIDIIIKANAGQDGKIFGSISSKNIIDFLSEQDSGIILDKNQVFINIPIKTLGTHSIQFILNPDVILVKNISVVSATDLNSNLINQNIDSDDDTFGYDYTSQVRSGDKKFDYLDREEDK